MVHTEVLTPKMNFMLFLIQILSMEVMFKVGAMLMHWKKSQFMDLQMVVPIGILS